MFIYTAKLPRRKIALWSLAAAALCCCALLVQVGENWFRQDVPASAAVSPKGIKTNEDRLEYLQEHGWLTWEQPLVTEELILPDVFDESYDEYLALQSAQGFDLTQYAGKRVKRYTYAVTNYPDRPDGVQANLLIYKNTVIGAEVLCPELDGFLHGLTMPAG